MLHLGILKTFNSTTYKAGVQLAGSLTTYLDDIAVATNIAPEAMVTGNYVLLAIPGGNPRDACVVASWPAGSSGGGGGGGGGTKIQDADGDTSWDVEETADEDKIHGVVKGVEAFLLHDDGILDLVKQSAFRAWSNYYQSIPHNTNTKVKCNVENYDNQGEYDNVTNYRFTPKKAGLYVFGASVEFRGVTVGDFCVMYMFKNGAYLAVMAYDAAVTAYHQTAGSAADKAAVGDYYELFVRHKHGSAVNIGNTIASCFWGATKIA